MTWRPAPFAFLTLLVACGDGAITPQTMDSGPNPTPDAEVGVVLDSGSAPLFDAGLIDSSIDSGPEAPADTGTEPDLGSPPVDVGSTPDAGDRVDCSAFSGEPELCSSTPTTCSIVFRNGAGCNAACAAGGLICVSSSRDDDDGASQCAPHPTDQAAFNCAETGHQSDYCVCAEDAACVPMCNGLSCGPDGCGGTCGTCPGNQTCNAGQCEPPPAVGCRSDSPTFSGTQNVSRTIVLDSPGVYDYNNVLHEWTGGGSCNQTENQPYILRIAASNVTLRNFAYRGAPDGIHIGTANDGQGHSSGRSITNIVLDNVTGWACEDAMTIQYGVQQVTIRNSLFLPNPNAQYRDKLLQFNFGDVEVANTTFYGGGDSLCMMFKGGQNIHVHDSCFMNCDRAMNGSTIHGIVGRISTARSELLSERNEGHHAARARTFWDPWKFYTGEGNVHIVGVGDTLNDNPREDMDQGATLTTRP